MLNFGSLINKLHMSIEISEKQWDQIKNEVQNQWDKITDDDFKKIDGSKSDLQNLIQKKYGADAGTKFNSLVKKCCC